MASPEKATDGPSVAEPEGWDYRQLPDWDDDFYDEESILAFASALSAPETSPSEEDLLNPRRQNVEFITALNDWRPVHQSVRSSKQRGGKSKAKQQRRRRPPRRGKDETREGWTYSLVKWPLLVFVLGWIFVLGVAYLLTRFYIYFYEQYVTWRGTRDRLRKNLRQQTSYEEWIQGAKRLDSHLGSDKWKEEDEYAYYDSRTIKRVMESMKRLRIAAERDERGKSNGVGSLRAVDDLVSLAEGCVKNNFAGFENPRLYSETYYGTKDLVQAYVDEVSTSLKFLFDSKQLTTEEKRNLAKHLSTNFGRTALCLSGGATFAYYHFGIAKALLDADLLPNIITGTSGGALVAGLLATRTDEELKQLLIPALAYRITACHDPPSVWVRRWWRTGARFDSVDWAKRCAWFCRGSLTFLEAYQRTGRILNVSCVPSDPHSPTILANYLTAPDCVIWSAVLASAAVPGILNPVVLMRKNRDGKLEPYSFGHKWKDGSLKTDIPLKSLNLHFNANFSIVSQANPHISLFFFSARGSIGRPVTHRRGRGWRGGFLGSAIEQYLKLDMNKWLKVLRHLELLPRPLGQDWSEIWLQRFSGTITIWPRSVSSDYWFILSDPSIARLARMLHVGQLAAWPKLKFVANRMAIEKVIENAREATRPLPTTTTASADREFVRQEQQQQHREQRALRNVLSEDDLRDLLEKARANHSKTVEIPPPLEESAISHEKNINSGATASGIDNARGGAPRSPSFAKRVSGWFGGGARGGGGRAGKPSRSGTSSPGTARSSVEISRPLGAQARRAAVGGAGAGMDSPLLTPSSSHSRRESVMEEIRRQSQVFFDDRFSDVEDSVDEVASEEDEGEEGFDGGGERSEVEG